MKDYHYANLLKLLEFSFSIEELKRFCFESDSYRDFQSKEPPNEAFRRELLSYALRRVVIDELLSWAKQNNRTRYDLHQPYYVERPEADVALSRRLTRERLVRFFKLDNSHPELAIYVSRHSTPTHFSSIAVSLEDISASPALKRIHEFQVGEAKQIAEAQYSDLREFVVVSAIELIEASRVMDEIDRSNLLNWFSGHQQELASSNIKVKLDVCPEQDAYKQVLGTKPTIFIGGPRANIGTYYYLYGEQAGEMRPRMMPNGVIETISDPENKIICGPDRNLGLIQRHQISSNNKTIIYLAGTGVNGTAAAVAYMRLHWIDILEEFGDDNFCKVIEVERRKKDDIPKYISREWTDNDWVVRK